MLKLLCYDVINKWNNLLLIRLTARQEYRSQGNIVSTLFADCYIINNNINIILLNIT